MNEGGEGGVWIMGGLLTFLLNLAIDSFIHPALHYDDVFSQIQLPQAVRGLLGLVLLFDIYTLYQQLQIHRMRRRLFEREELSRLISENAADLIAVVDMEGRRIYNSLSYQKVLGYSEEELKSSTYTEQVHPGDRERVKEAAEEARRNGIGRPLEYRIRHKDGSWRALEARARVVCEC